MGFEPTTLREPTESHMGLAFIYEYSSHVVVVSSLTYSLWRLVGSILDML